jgi:protoporphyrin/coproporphyrin ferrochelatase
MSPLIEITRAQAKGLEAVREPDFRVTTGMRFSEPSVADAASDVVARGAQRLLGLILSPQYSPLLMGGYDQALQAAADGIPARAVAHGTSMTACVDILASRVRAALADFPGQTRPQVPVLLTAHSLQGRVVDREPDYVAQLRATAGLGVRVHGTATHSNMVALVEAALTAIGVTA